MGREPCRWNRMLPESPATGPARLPREDERRAVAVFARIGRYSAKRPCGEPDPARPGRDPAGAARWYQDLGPHSGVCVQLYAAARSQDRVCHQVDQPVRVPCG